MRTRRPGGPRDRSTSRTRRRRPPGSLRTLITDDNRLRDTENSLDGARSATRELLAPGEAPTAIFCASDELALGCMHELRMAGLRVPADVSVAGFDDTRYAAVSNPPLTTIRQPAEEMGVYLIDELCATLEEETENTGGSVVVPHQLIIRDSVCRND